MYRYLSLSLAIFISCGGGGNSVDDNTDRSPKPVKSIVATTSEVVQKSFAGLSTPEMEVNLAFKVAGQILTIPVITGEEVMSGDVLAQIDPRDLELAVAADKSTFEQARSSYERSMRLLEREAISKQEAESSESAYMRSKSAYENSLELLNQTTLRAPFQAVIERVIAQEFQRVQSGESVIRVVSPTTDRVSFTIPENSLYSIQDSTTRFKVAFDNYPGESFDADIIEYARSSSDASGFPVTLAINNPLPSRFYINSGLSCTITMMTRESNHDMIILPLSAIYAPTSGGTYVWIIDKSNRVEQRRVVLGSLTDQNSVRVEQGVDSGERIVTAGVYQITDNQEVKIIE